MVGLHNDESNWENPTKFIPERFDGKIKAGTFVPFSDGPRSCIGQHFARLEFLVLMSTLVRRLDLTPDPSYKFGMMFNGFGWMASDMGNMMAGSQVRMQLAVKEKSKSCFSPVVIVF